MKMICGLVLRSCGSPRHAARAVGRMLRRRCIRFNSWSCNDRGPTMRRTSRRKPLDARKRPRRNRSRRPTTFDVAESRPTIAHDRRGRGVFSSRRGVQYVVGYADGVPQTGARTSRADALLRAAHGRRRHVRIGVELSNRASRRHAQGRSCRARSAISRASSRRRWCSERCSTSTSTRRSSKFVAAGRNCRSRRRRRICARRGC